MAKKEVKEETAAVEATSASNAVSVEMTPEQRDEFVAFMKAKEEKESDKLAGEKRVNVRLSTAHYINGVTYGPGVTNVPMSLLGKLQDQESKWREHELAIFAPSKDHLKRIFEGGQVVNMPVSAAPESVKKAFG